jgi:leucyl-tRNA synthetase
VGEAVRARAEGEAPHSVQVKYHQTVKRVTEGLEELRYNTSIAALMEFVNTLREESCTSREMVEGLVLMLAPFAPHFARRAGSGWGTTAQSSRPTGQSGTRAW